MELNNNVPEISGTMTTKDVKRLTRALRTGTVGPTTVYYAGVTAPIISAGVGVFARQMLSNTGALSIYWLWMISTLIAAFAGICWYLIFIRWSYRNTYGRGDETDAHSDVRFDKDGLTVTREFVTSKIKWRGVTEIRKHKGFSAIMIEGSDPILIPDHWFNKDKAAKTAFFAEISKRLSEETQ